MNYNINGLPKTTSIWLYAFLGALAGLGVVGAWYFGVEPFHTLLNPLIGPVAAFVSGLVPALSGAAQTFYTYFVQNPVGAILGGVAGISGLYTIVSKIQSSREKQQAMQEIANAQSMAVQATNDLVKAEAEKKALQDQIKSLQSGDQSKTVSSMQATIDSLTKQNATLQTRYNEASQFLNVVQSPSTEVMKRKLEEADYIVTKKVK